jgi:hypothetical protein
MRANTPPLQCASAPELLQFSNKFASPHVKTLIVMTNSVAYPIATVSNKCAIGFQSTFYAFRNSRLARSRGRSARKSEKND